MIMKISRLVVVIFLFLFRFSTLIAQVNFPSFISDNMVLQRETEAQIWGNSEPNSSVKISCSWDEIKYVTTANESGKWQIKVKTPVAGGPHSIQVNKINIENVMIGEVWICSGQSNMKMSLSQSENGKEELANAELPNIRLFYVARQLADKPQEDCYGKWEECSPESAKTFSAVAYYFGKKLYQELGVPIGLIHTSWGGSTAQAWVKQDILKADSDYDCYYDVEEQKELRAKPGIIPITHHSPSRLYNAMIHPLMPYRIKGVIWYQGESNQDYCPGDPKRYEKLFPELIYSWRDEWKLGDFPFYYVQIAPFPRRITNVGALLRDAQRKSLNVPNTGMAVTLDIGDIQDIHPKNKKDVGQRLALWALAKDYGRTSLVYSGPLYKSLEIKGSKAIVSFDEIGSGLMSKDETLSGFEIAGKNKVFYPAKARIKGEAVMVWSDKIGKPVSVRYAFHNTSEASLFNKEGLPASSFRTDNWEVKIEPVIKE